MVRCLDCNKEMLDHKTTTCEPNAIKIKGEIYLRNTEYYDINERCHDCGIQNKMGNIHHLGCDMEACPKCSGQLISCGCLSDDEYELVNVKYPI